jgi:hypothetical protein
MEPRDWKVSKISKPLERTNTGNQLQTNFGKQGGKKFTRGPGISRVLECDDEGQPARAWLFPDFFLKAVSHICQQSE